LNEKANIIFRRLPHSYAVGQPGFEVVMECLMLICLKHHDKNSTTTEQLEISLVMPEEMPFSQVSYTALKAMFGVLYGSI
jgi:hypothetical protein